MNKNIIIIIKILIFVLDNPKSFQKIRNGIGPIYPPP